MLSTRRVLVTAVFVFFSLNAFAADIPQIDIQSQELNKEECINNTTQNCINNQCLTSEARDCQEQCAALSKAQCEEQADE
jgi:hypothetical protein